MKANKSVKKEEHGSEDYMGRRFQVTITEVYQRKIMVSEAEMKEPSVAEAGRMVVDWWKDEQIILGTDDFQGIEVTAKEVTEHADDTSADDTSAEEAAAADTSEGAEPGEEAQ